MNGSRSEAETIGGITLPRAELSAFTKDYIFMFIPATERHAVFIALFVCNRHDTPTKGRLVHTMITGRGGKHISHGGGSWCVMCVMC